ncbi:putative integral membrane protein [Cryptosporidium felis]|nr:putative integral membrane protein [Cryptosporidium felis]
MLISLLVVKLAFIFIGSRKTQSLVTGESSFLNDVEIIKAKIPGFNNFQQKSNIYLDNEDLERVSKGTEGNLTNSNGGPLTGENGPPLIIPHAPKVTTKALKEFDTVKLVEIENEIEEELDVIKEKIEKLKSALIEGQGEDASASLNQSEVPVLAFPKRFESPEEKSEEVPSIDPKIVNWINNIDKYQDDPEGGPKSPANRKNTILQDPTLHKCLRETQLSKPNWKGSATHLVKGAVIRDELLDELDDEGRSIAVDQEPVLVKEATLGGEFSQMEDKLVSLEQRAPGVELDPEDLSIEEKKLNVKPIITNEIPSGEILGEKNFSYEGEMFSSKKRDGMPILPSPEQFDYVNIDDLIEEKPILFQEEVNKSGRVKCKVKRKDASIESKEPTEFSLPEFDSQPLELKPKEFPTSKRKSKKLPIHSKSPKKSRKKAAKTQQYFGYSELKFENSGSPGSEPSPVLPTSKPLPSPELPSIEPPVSVEPLPSLRPTTIKKNLKYKNTKIFSEKNRTPIYQSNGYSELFNIENGEFDPVKEITKDTNSPRDYSVPHIPCKMPKRNKKLPTWNIKEDLKSSTLHSPAQEKGLKVERLSMVKGNMRAKLSMHRLSGTSSSKIHSDSEQEKSSDIFEESGPSPFESTHTPLKIKDMLAPSATEGGKPLSIVVPNSNLPKRKKK